MWIEILKKSYAEDLKIKKNTVVGFIVIEPENLSQKHKTPKSKKKIRKRYYQKRGTSGSRKTTTATTKENSEDVFFQNMISLMPVQTQLIKQQK